MTPLVAGAGAIFIDDIVLPDGQTYMGRLGGGVTHAMMGAALWGVRPGIIALAGQGLPAAAQRQLEQHLDTQGLHWLELPQIRAWQIHEEDGTRRELYRVAETAPYIMGAQPEHFPPAYQGCRALYLLQDFEGAIRWREAFDGLILWEPLQQIMTRGARGALCRTLQRQRVDIVSPNLAEAREVYNLQRPEDLASALLEEGAKMVVLRMGAQGSLIAHHNGEQCWIPPAYTDEIIDQTGAGNTYCGAFLTGVAQGKRLDEAGAMGAVAASFCLEQAGVIDLSRINLAARDARLDQIMRSRAV